MVITVNKKMRGVLCWLPVVILPVSNLVMVMMTSTALQASLTYIFGAIIEEALFRWLLLKHLLLDKEGLAPVPSIAIVAVLFASMHLCNLAAGADATVTIIQFVFAFSFSVWAGAVVWRAQSIAIPLLAHVLLNLTGSGDMLPMSVATGIVVLIDGILLMCSSDCV